MNNFESKTKNIATQGQSTPFVQDATTSYIIEQAKLKNKAKFGNTVKDNNANLNGISITNSMNAS